MSTSTDTTTAETTGTRVPRSAIGWAEIPVRDLAPAIDFYAAVLGNRPQLDESGPNPMAVFAYGAPGQGCSGHLYPGTPATDGAGPTVHLSVTTTVEVAAEAFREHGGTIVGPVIEIPAGRFQYGIDPDGNSIGLFETPRV